MALQAGGPSICSQQASALNKGRLAQLMALRAASARRAGGGRITHSLEGVPGARRKGRLFGLLAMDSHVFGCSPSPECGTSSV
jgi:hypothetical protein